MRGTEDYIGMVCERGKENWNVREHTEVGQKEMLVEAAFRKGGSLLGKQRSPISDALST